MLFRSGKNTPIVRVNLSKNNPISKINFSKFSKVQVGSVLLSQLGDVTTTGQKNGDVLVYNTNTSSYYIQTLPALDGGVF